MDPGREVEVGDRCFTVRMWFPKGTNASELQPQILQARLHESKRLIEWGPGEPRYSRKRCPFEKVAIRRGDENSEAVWRRLWPELKELPFREKRSVGDLEWNTSLVLEAHEEAAWRLGGPEYFLLAAWKRNGLGEILAKKEVQLMVGVRCAPGRVRIVRSIAVVERKRFHGLVSPFKYKGLSEFPRVGALVEVR